MKIKTVVLTVSKHFMVDHCRAGQKTHFEHLIGNKTKIHTIREINENEYWENKIKQIQEGKAELSIREWTGKPYASKQRKMFTFQSKVGYQIITYSGKQFFLNDKALKTTELAANDGLLIADFLEWFKSAKEGQKFIIIHFTNFRYGSPN